MAKNKTVRIALVQMSMTASKEENLEKAISFIEKAAEKKAKIVCLPELFNTLYFPQKKKDKNAFDLAEKIPGKTTKRLCALAKKLHIIIVAPLYEKVGSKYFNTSVLISDNGKLMGKYHKMHIPHDPCFYEKNYFEEGDLGFKIFKTKYGNIAPMICFDQWFPEAARISVLKGADIIFYSTAIGNITGRHSPDNWADAWVTVQRGHAIANGVHVAAVNRVGREELLVFFGNSFICNSFGKILKRAGNKKEELVIADLDLSNNKRIRETWMFFKKRRPESYNSIVSKK